MKNEKLLTATLALAIVSMCSCTKEVMDEAGLNAEKSSTLTVRTRAAQEGEGNGKISYPINIYVMDGKNACVETLKLASDTNELAANLPEGTYTVYAIAGASEADYDLPSKENASPQSPVTLKESKTHSDLMAAQSTVKLEYGEENTLTLSLSRKVMMLENATIENVPASVKNVSISVIPLYESLLLDGTYSGNNGSETIALEKQADTNTWQSASAKYALAASGPATIKVSMTSASGKTKSYSYSSPETLEANYKIQIKGSYTSSEGIILKGIITGDKWQGTKIIEFTFDESGGTTGGIEEKPGGNEGGEGEKTEGNAPKPGTMYEGCFVLRSQSTGSTTTVTLLSKQELSKLKFTDGDQASIKEAVENGISQLTSETKVKGWRLPSKDELEYINSNFDSVNDGLSACKCEGMYKNSGGTTYHYYFLKPDGTITSYSLFDQTEKAPRSERASFILRAFTTLEFSE